MALLPRTRLLALECAAEHKRCKGRWKCLRAHTMLRQANPQWFTPQMFNLGPYSLHPTNTAFDNTSGLHPGSAQQLQRVLKVRILQEVIMQDGHFIRELEDFQRLVDKIAERDSFIRATYIDIPPGALSAIDRSSLASLLVLDGVAVVTALQLPQYIVPSSVRQIILSDLLLLENQLPLFVLFDVLEFMRNSPARACLVQCVRFFYQICTPLLSLEFKPHLLQVSDDGLEELHPEWWKTCLLHHLYVSLTEYPAEGGDQSEVEGLGLGSESASQFEESIRWNAQLPGASRLAKCGIRFRASKGHNFSTGLRLDGATLTLSLPEIRIGHNTPRLFVNLLAYEMAYASSLEDTDIHQYRHGWVLTSYLSFMKSLIRSAEDAEVLVQAGVLTNLYGSSEELAAAWRMTQTNVVFYQTLRHHLITKRLVVESRKRWRTWVVTLKETYLLNQPWLIVSVMAATCLLVLSILQTIYTIQSSRG